MDKRRSFLRRFLIGVPLGMISCLIITVLTSTGNANDGHIHLVTGILLDRVGNETTALIIQEIVTGLYGGIVMGATVAYDMEQWSILRCTLTHFVTTFVLYYLTAISMGWFSIENVAEWLIMLAVMIVVYTFIWLANYLSYRRDIEHMNRKLENMKEPDEDVRTDDK